MEPCNEQRLEGNSLLVLTPFGGAIYVERTSDVPLSHLKKLEPGETKGKVGFHGVPLLLVEWIYLLPYNLPSDKNLTTLDLSRRLSLGLYPVFVHISSFGLSRSLSRTILLEKTLTRFGKSKDGHTFVCIRSLVLGTSESTNITQTNRNPGTHVGENEW